MTSPTDITDPARLLAPARRATGRPAAASLTVAAAARLVPRAVRSTREARG
ncbi:hypothetical protein [Streptomyces kurssanovii]|uniref:Uncharacterized protein n=1 Tax=Streptomyces kurssanovii TaxID=67312 RepID=A0ABV3HRG2_9ACTN